MSKPVVLCVDDNIEVLTSIVRSLRPLGMEVLSTSSAREALAWIGSRQIAVLISDFEMPTMTGVELATAARHVSPATVRILISGKRVFETAVDGINQGEVFRFISKPFDPKGFREVVKAAVDRHRDLIEEASERDLTLRRGRVVRELEAGAPDLTHVERTSDGAYLVPPDRSELLEQLGLGRLRAFRRQS